MDEWLGHPAVQGGVLPFLVALALAATLVRTRFLAFAQAAGVLVCATLAIGWSLESLTSTRKLVLIAGCTPLLAMAIEAGRTREREVTVAAVALLAALSVWMLWRLLAQREAGPAVLEAALAAAYVALVVGATVAISGDPLRGACCGLSLGLGAGAIAILGASAVLGVTGISAGAAAGATLLVQMIAGRASPAGRSLSLPAATVAGLTCVAAVATAELAWYCLLPLPLVPLAARLVPATRWPAWRRAVITSGAAFVPSMAAIALAWFRPF